MLPSLLKQCWVHGAPAACKQLVSLSAFRVRRLPYSTHESYRSHPEGASQPRGDVTARSRRRNIFLEPADKDEALTALYDSSRFNDGDDWDAPAAPAAAHPAPGAAPSSIAHEAEDDDEPELPAALLAAGGGALQLPPARNVRVKSAEFIKSSVDVAGCPPAVYPEFAVIGRSNVGKSSLINLLTGRNSLAMVSKTPGKTKLINHFLINKAWYLVDLPGYGYARASKDKVLTWNRFTREYFLERTTLAAVLLLIDASIPPMELDLSCADWLGEAGVAYTLVYTKVDKRKKGEPPVADNVAAFEAALAQRCDALPPAVATSSRSGAGKMELLAHVARLRALYNAHRL